MTDSASTSSPARAARSHPVRCPRCRSAAAFTVGAALPLLAVLLAPSSVRIEVTMAATALALALTGWSGARLGGAPPARGTLRVVVWGIAAMVLTMLVGRLVGTTV